MNADPKPVPRVTDIDLSASAALPITASPTAKAETSFMNLMRKPSSASRLLATASAILKP